MSVLSDREITFRCFCPHYSNPKLGGVHPTNCHCLSPLFPMIEPFVASQIKTTKEPGEPTEKVISYGLSSYGYDLRLANEFMVFSNIAARVIDPKNFDLRILVPMRAALEDGYITIPPGGFALGKTIEYLRIPRDIVTLCIGKSTYARCGIVVNVTPFEPEWEGCPTIEITNPTPLPCRVYAGEGIAQVLFLQNTTGGCFTSYADRKGKYQGDTAIRPPTA